MKATDLMLGDYITLADSLQDGKPLFFKVVGIGCDGENSALVLLNGEKACDVVEIDDEWRGIPITPEILEKNGFKVMHGFSYSETYPTYGWGYYKTFRDNASVDVTFYDEPIAGVSTLVRMGTNSSAGDGTNNIHSCDCNYIHQLQHALRLCGIKKEIVL